MSTHQEHKNYVLPIKAYLGVAAALFLMTIVTVAVSFVDLGGWNAIVAVGIATFKALLVAFIFMHLLYDKKINLFVFSMGLVFVSIFISLTMFDTLRRADIYEIKAKPIQENAAMYDSLKSDSTSVKTQAKH